METKKIKVRVTERKTKDGRTFKVFHTFSKNGRRTEVKFRKTVKQIPEKDCYIVVDVEAMNLNTSGEYPVLWVQDVVSIVDMSEATAEQNKKKINEYFE